MSTEHTDNSIPSKDSTPTNAGTPGTPETTQNEQTNNKKPLVEITPELAAELSEHHKALAQEFELANKELTANTDSIDLKEYWKRKVPDAAGMIAWLSLNAHSEGVKLNASKYVIEQAYSDTGNSELETILRELTGNKT